jgi:hypothetical protein
MGRAEGRETCGRSWMGKVRKLGERAWGGVRRCRCGENDDIQDEKG